MQLVLSLFSGIGLLDKAFKEAGFCVVSAGDIINGSHFDIRDFAGLKNKFDGIIGGSPCQDFSTLKRNRGNYSLEMMYEFLRVVSDCEPDWYLLENVKGVPNVTELLKNSVTLQDKNVNVTELLKYSHQRIDINQGWYDNYSRLRHIQFGSKNDLYLNIPRGTMKDNILGGCALASDDRSFKELCSIQGLEPDFDLPDFNVKGKKKVVGNGVPLSIGRVLAKAVLDVTVPGQIFVTLQHQTFSKISQGNCDILKRDIPAIKKERHKYQLPDTFTLNSRYAKERRCACGCKRVVTGRKIYYDASCRKRAQRIRNIL
ncbi:MAG: DNA cytosine methyltransferase [Sulfurimonas sp.]|uniref:DNA cytosine methyltransferase n=1 Tax=Sulfurimonas sp. TaxID=2022749 RepID=UPI003D0BE008